MSKLAKQHETVKQLLANSTAGKSEYRRALAEMIQRKCEALRLYDPQPHQVAFHSSKTRTVVMQKGNQVGGEQPYTSCIITPNGKTTLGELDVGDVILGGDGLPCIVEGVQEYGDSPVYRFTFSDGTTCEAGENHKWTVKLGGKAYRPASASVDEPGWRVHTTSEILAFLDKHGYRYGTGRGSSHYRVCFPVAIARFAERPVPIDPYTLGVLIGDGNFTHSAINVTSEDEELVGAMSLPAGCKMAKLSNKSTTIDRYGKASAYGISGTAWHNNPLADGLKALGLHGCRGHEKFIPQSYLYNSIDVRLGVLRGLMDTDGNCGLSGSATFYTTSTRLVEDITDLVRSLGGKASATWRENAHDGTPGRPLAHVSISLPGLNPFRLSRKRLRRSAKLKHKYRPFRYLEKIEYIGVKPCRCIKVGNASLTYLTDNYVVTHNTLAACVEIARAVTGQDPYNKYPKENGVACILGYGEGHIGDVFYPKLFKAGAFDIIKDLATGDWRTYRPWPSAQGGDLERVDEIKPAPPLIPRRFIKDIAWEVKNKRIFKKVFLTTGWELRAYNSAGDPGQAQGFLADYYGVDEDTANTGWIEEILFRLAKRAGLLRWTAKPHGKNDEMLKLLQKAEEETEAGGKRTVEVVRAAFTDNRYIEKSSADEIVTMALAMGEDVYRARVLGELDMTSTLMYPTFDRRTHDVMQTACVQSPAQKALAANRGEPPADWTRYAIIDPGAQVLAVLFVAIPPDSDQMFVYDECYIMQPSSPSEALGEAMARKCSDSVFEAFIIDIHGGRLRGIGSGDIPVDKYRDALAKRGIRSNATDSGFRHGCDDIRRREEDMRIMLSITRDGWPRLMVCVQKCPKLCWELERFRKKTVRQGGVDVPIDQGNRKAHTHAVECCEMAVSSNLGYVRPVKKAKDVSWLDNALEWGRKQQERIDRGRAILGDGDSINLGPQGATV